MSARDDIPIPEPYRGAPIPFSIRELTANAVINRIENLITGSEPKGVGDVYYVSTSGSDSSGDGSKTNPWKTIDYAVGQCTADNNDYIMVAPGTYDEGGTTGVEVDVNSIHIIGDLSNNYQTRIRNTTGGATAVFTVTADNTEIAGFYINVTGTVKSVYGPGPNIGPCHIHRNVLDGDIHLSGGYNWFINDNFTDGSTTDGIKLSSTTYNCIIYRNIIHGVADVGIDLSGAFVTDNWVIGNFINGDNGTTNTGIGAGGDANSIIRNSVGGCVIAGTDSGANNVKRDNHGEFGTIASYPSGAGPVTCTGGAISWSYGAWVEVIAGAVLAQDFEIIGIQFLVNTATDYEVAIGIGAGGSETKIIHVPTDTQAVNTEYVFMFGQLGVRKVRAGTRIAVACSTTAGGGTENAQCKVILRTDVW